MTDHIYGRTNILGNNERPHMFIKELSLNLNFLKEQASALESAQDATQQRKGISDFGKQLLTGIEYYRSVSGYINACDQFNQHLDQLESEIRCVLDTVLVEKISII